MKSPARLGTAVVTGASEGIGAEYALALANQGYDLILIARNRERLNTLAAQISDQTRQSAEVLALDLNSHHGVSEVEAKLRTDASITMLVNNAGLAATKPLIESDIEQIQDMIWMNVDVLTRFTYAIAPIFLARGRGAIINIASVVALNPLRLNGVYAGTKAFVLAFTRSLHHELSPKGIRVQAVLPGMTRTDIWRRAGVDPATLPKEAVMDARVMVEAALEGFRMGEVVTIPSLPDPADWETYEEATRSLFPNLSRSLPALRYRTSTDGLNS